MRDWGLFLAFGAALVLSCTATFGDQLDEFAKVKRPLQQQLRHKQPAERMEALKQLQKFPLADSVKMIQTALLDDEPEVREAAYRTLLALNGSYEVCETLLSQTRKALGQKKDLETAAPLLAVLLTSNLPSIKRDTNELFEKGVASKNAAPIAMSLADLLGAHGSPLDVAPLLRIAKLAVFTESFGVRRAVVDALCKIQSPLAVGALVELMDKVGGEPRADAIEHLTHVTEQIYGQDTAAWKTWWSKSGDTWEYPKRVGPTPYRSGVLTADAQYYGLPIFAEKVVFVLDTSGSMNGPRIVMAKRELINAIRQLSGDAYFGIVVFNSHVAVWQHQLVRANDTWKKAAAAYIESQPAQLNTASYDALEAAFNFDTEAIYFVSDGAPNGGKIGAPIDIIAAITTGNRTRRVSLYTIGVAPGFPGSPLDEFLRVLARENWGNYRRVDE